MVIPANAAQERVVTVESGRRRLEGILTVPVEARGVVVFAHGSGSGRFSPRNQFVARALREAGLATFLLDLLDAGEAAQSVKVFNIELVAYRVQKAADWLADERLTRDLRLGYFGASTGAAAALVAAARYPAPVRAVVSRGGRLDPVREDLPAVRPPTLLIVGGNDQAVLEFNQQTLHLLRCPKKLVVVPCATHRFLEPGAMDEVARLATEWFTEHLLVTHDPGARVPRKDMDQQC